MTATLTAKELTKERVDHAVNIVLDTLGQPETDTQEIALEAFHAGDSALIKRYSIGNLDDNFLKCLGYLVSAVKLTANTDTILAESARAAIAHQADIQLKQVSRLLYEVLES